MTHIWSELFPPPSNLTAPCRASTFCRCPAQLLCPVSCLLITHLLHKSFHFFLPLSLLSTSLVFLGTFLNCFNHSSSLFLNSPMSPSCNLQYHSTSATFQSTSSPFYNKDCSISCILYIGLFLEPLLNLK